MRLNKVRTMGLLSLPLMAIALAVVLVSGGFFSSEKTAATAGTPEVSLGVADGSDCTPSAKPVKCNVPTGGVFHLTASVNAFPSGGYSALAADVDWTAQTGVNYTKRANNLEVVWPQRGNVVGSNSMVTATNFQYGDLSTGSGGTPSTFKGVVLNLEFTCKGTASTNTILLKPYDPATNPGGTSLADNTGAIFPASDSISINCVTAPTPTVTSTRTNTPTPTNTPTTVPIPRMQKLPALQNLFLQRMGTKIAPTRCVDGFDGVAPESFAGLVESIHIPIGGVDPKDATIPREIGGFSFQVKYNPLKVCINLTPGPAWTSSPAQICTVEDSVSKPTLQGVARINCVTLGKATVVDTDTAEGRVLAIIQVAAQPEAWSQIRANQDNGQVVQLNDEACKLTDLQGHAIEVFSCEDADVTIRFLEGDVEPDCQVNTLDTQSIAFRWGATKGSLIFQDRFNLEPSGTQADQDIDVNDLQFVYGRFGSTCASPWPAQVPIKAK